MNREAEVWFQFCRQALPPAVPVLRSRRGNDREPPPPVDPVSFEIGVVDRENPGDRLPLGKVNQSRVGEIHRMVAVARHECAKVREVLCRDCAKEYVSGSKKAPNHLFLDSPGDRKMEKLGEYRGRSHQRHSQLDERIPAQPVPPVVAIEAGQNRARVNQAISGHTSDSSARGPALARIPLGAGLRH